MYSYTNKCYNECRAENLMSADWPINIPLCPPVDSAAMFVMCGSHTVPKEYWSETEKDRVLRAKQKRARRNKMENDRIEEMIADFEARNFMENR